MSRDGYHILQPFLINVANYYRLWAKSCEIDYENSPNADTFIFIFFHIQSAVIPSLLSLKKFLIQIEPFNSDLQELKTNLLADFASNSERNDKGLPESNEYADLFTQLEVHDPNHNELNT